MSLDGILSIIASAPETETLLDMTGRGVREHAAYGLSGSQKSYLVAALHRRAGSPCLYVTQSLSQAERVREDLATWLGEGRVALFPALEVLPYEVLAQGQELASARLRVLERLLDGEPLVVVAPLAALLLLMVPPGVLASARLDLEPGGSLNLEEALPALVRWGYERVDLVEGPGQFSLRGGILDIYPPTRTAPLRVELFGDEIDSLREFDVASQRSSTSLERARVFPASELVVDETCLEQGLEAIRREASTTVATLARQGRVDRADRLRQRIDSVLERLSTGAQIEGFHNYLPFFFPEPATLLDYLPGEALVFLDEPARLREGAGELEVAGQQRYADLLADGQVLPSQANTYISYAGFISRARRQVVLYLSLLLKRVPHGQPGNIVSFSARPMQAFHGQLATFLEVAGRWRRQGARTIILASSADRARKLARSLTEEGVEVSFSEIVGEVPPAGTASVTVGSLENGFEFPGLGLAVVTEEEIFGRQKRRRPPAEAVSGGTRIRTYRELEIGDYVVHASHGIGKYLGIRALEVEGVQRDYLFIKYAGEDRLYVPTDQIGLIQKYVGAEGQEPKLNRLGGTEWSRVKNRVRESIQKMAEELLRLYAAREALPGHPFSTDTPWQREFEDQFPYEETPDQLHAAEEIKRDMERARPMDRLLCGDVGYGKTEVAIRAAFKAVMDGKQVAVLVPTTILAQQHYNTFRERFSGYPVTIDVLSRFRSAGEQERTVRSVRQGTVDVLIGTHRLLGEDVRFKDLGLLIVDEEQRFGVAHKERLKQLRQHVDVLTLTATPIPRTLHMAMVGLRDMSVIETPPENRFPVQTYVVEYRDDLIRDAIQRELARGGQVYYVHNRIQTIDAAAARLQRLVPEARIAVGHGQMKEEKLERVMLDFLDGQYDILLSTTIIESGLDIANVNTLIVEDADHLGLAQLYQLRGRVGRSNRLAYAYFTYKRDKVLSEIAEKRLQAIRDFTEFGAGFQIAMRDLEIRGAGNILGPEQHGFIVSVGFDLYCQLLDEAIRTLKGEKKEEKPQPAIELIVDAYIPDSYIRDPRQKIDAYKKIVAIDDLAAALEVEDELVDRFGEPPVPVKNLLSIARIKVRAARAGVTSVSQQKDQVVLKFRTYGALVPERQAALGQRYRGLLDFHPGRQPYLSLRTRGATQAVVLSNVEGILAVLDGQAC